MRFSRVNYLRGTGLALLALTLSACGFHTETIKPKVVTMNDNEAPIVINAPVIRQPNLSTALMVSDHVSYFTHHGFEFYRFYSLQSVDQLVKENLDHTFKQMQIPVATMSPFHLSARTTQLDISTMDSIKKPVTLKGVLTIDYRLTQKGKFLWRHAVTSTAQMAFNKNQKEGVAVQDLVEFLLNNNTSEMGKDLVQSCTFYINDIDCSKYRL